MRETLAALGITALALAAGACLGKLVALAYGRPSDRRTRLAAPPGRPRPPYANQLGQLGVLPFTEHPNDARHHEPLPTRKELENLRAMVDEDCATPPLRPQGTAVFREGEKDDQ